MTNINNEFESFNIKLVPYNVNDDYVNKTFKSYLNDDGDFEDYTLSILDDASLDMFSLPNSNLSFCIYLKKSNEFIGIISLAPVNDSPFNDFNEEETKASISYYILKKYRKNGYCKEATMLLINMAFNDYLKVNLNNNGKELFGFCTANISLISAITSCDNEASGKVLTANLFEKMGRLNKYKKVNNKFVDVDYYELSREKYLKREELCKKAINIINLSKKGVTK